MIKVARRTETGRLEWLTVFGWARMCEFMDEKFARETAKDFGEDVVELYEGDGVRMLQNIEEAQ